MLKIKDDVDLKELEKFGFIEYNDSYKRDYYNDYLTSIDKETREILKVDYEWSFLKNKYKRKYPSNIPKIDAIRKSFLLKFISKVKPPPKNKVLVR